MLAEIGLSKKVECVQAVYKGDDEIEEAEKIKSGDTLKFEVLPGTPMSDDEGKIENTTEATSGKPSLITKPLLKKSKLDFSKLKAPVM